MNAINAQWLFFDIGYTLVDEDDVWKKRAEEQITLENLNYSVPKLLEEIERNTANYNSKYSDIMLGLGYTKIAPYTTKYEKVYCDASEVLSKLYKKYKLGIIANQIEGCEERLYKYGILKYFNVVVYSHDKSVMSSKPDEQIFKIALARANCNANDAVMIGDRYDNDIYPAKRLGFKTIRIKQGNAKNQTPINGIVADVEINNLKELLEIL